MRMKNKNAGFSLVELIVVIAIMAVLAGVAVAGYGVYTENANKAADEALLYEINLAFKSACAEEGIDFASLGTATARMSIDATTQELDRQEVYPESVRDEFNKYFEVTSAKFKVYKSLYFQNGMFYGSETENAYLTMIEAFKNQYASILGDVAGFGGNMGMEALMYQLADVTGIAAEMAKEGGAAANALNGILESNEFNRAAMEALGISDPAELESTFDSLVAEMQAQNPGMSYNDAFAKVQANAAVLYTAKMSASYTDDKAKELFTNASAGEIATKMTSGDAEGIAQAALVCGMYTAYINRYNIDAEVTVDNVLEALATDENFQNYLNTTDGQADLDGYLGSMQILSGTADGTHSAEVENLMLNGFADENLIAGLGSLVG